MGKPDVSSLLEFSKKSALKKKEEENLDVRDIRVNGIKLHNEELNHVTFHQILLG
jgi:hypothetical protein